MMRVMRLLTAVPSFQTIARTFVLISERWACDRSAATILLTSNLLKLTPVPKAGKLLLVLFSVMYVGSTSATIVRGKVATSAINRDHRHFARQPSPPSSA